MEKEVIKEFYAQEGEKERLELEIFKLEGIRTKEIISRYLHKKPMTIADIGGGAGFYSFWLQQMGYSVSLVDLSPRHIELAKAQAKRTGIELSSYQTGDATQLDLPDEQFDLVLMLGPLYHLIDKDERVKALSEAKRLVKPGGYVLAAVISRYASLFDGFNRDLVNDDQFFKLLKDDLNTGIHRNETGNPEYFTTAYFHTPAEIREEVKASGLQLDKLIPVESFGWIINDFATKSTDKDYMQKLNTIIEMIEDRDDLIAMSQHVVAVGRRGDFNV